MNLGTYLGEVEHPEVGVHVHGPCALARLTVQLGRLAEATLVRVDVAQEDLRVVLAALATLLSHTNTCLGHTSCRRHANKYVQKKLQLYGVHKCRPYIANN